MKNILRSISDFLQQSAFEENAYYEDPDYKADWRYYFLWSLRDCIQFFIKWGLIAYALMYILFPMAMTSFFLDGLPQMCSGDLLDTLVEFKKKYPDTAFGEMYKLMKDVE